MNNVVIDGITYIPETEVQKLAEDTSGLKYCIIRTYSAGVHSGYLAERNGKEVKLINARRLWKWAGAFTLSEIAVDGVKKPEECKFSKIIPEIILTEAIEIISCTEKARGIIEEVSCYDC